MEDNRVNENPAQSFVKRLVKAFSAIVSLLRGKREVCNQELVVTILSKEENLAHTPEAKEAVAEKKKAMMAVCEGVDIYREKKAQAAESEDLDEWFSDQISDFTHATIADANAEDVNEVKEMMSNCMDEEIRLRADIYKEEASTNEEAAE